jgi:hypothetical protein
MIITWGRISLDHVFPITIDTPLALAHHQTWKICREEMHRASPAVPQLIYDVPLDFYHLMQLKRVLSLQNSNYYMPVWPFCKRFLTLFSCFWIYSSLFFLLQRSACKNFIMVENVLMRCSTVLACNGMGKYG